ncbi:MAG: BlaI/MecI/CopY family transcriptional regulator [Planctomycetales bacterium]|nr:BlaI/MecI/CopY family transcriptional regulator [Planctomycetales bacterium]
MAKQNERDLSKAEWALMSALWARERGTATEIQKDLQDTQGWAYSTVKTMLDRLVEKGFVSFRRVGNVYEYFPSVHRKSAIARALDDMIDRVLDGAITPFFSRLLERRQLKASEVEELKSILNQHGQDASDSDSNETPRET